MGDLEGEAKYAYPPTNLVNLGLGDKFSNDRYERLADNPETRIELSSHDRCLALKTTHFLIGIL